MAKAKPAAAAKTATTVPAGYGSDAPATTNATEAAENTGGTPAKGKVEHNPSIPSDKELIAKTNAANKEKADAEKAEKAKAKAEKQAVKDAEKAEKAAARATAKTERETRIAALAADGKNYTGSMLALADRVKQGVYVKGSNGQLRSNDELAIALDGISATDVVRIGLDLLKIEDNPYTKLNIGQQSMNLRNRMRGAIKKETLTIAAVTEYVTRNKIVVVSADDVAKARADKAERVAKAKADKEAKAAAAATAKAAKPEAEAKAA